MQNMFEVGWWEDNLNFWYFLFLLKMLKKLVGVKNVNIEIKMGENFRVGCGAGGGQGYLVG